MTMFHENINSATVSNPYFRRVLFTTPNMQLVVMSLFPGEEIGSEVHPYITQFIRVEKGTGIAVIDGVSYELYDDVAIIIPLGSQHNIINTSQTESMKLYTIYSPPNHPYDRVDIGKPENEECH